MAAKPPAAAMYAASTKTSRAYRDLEALATHNTVDNTRPGVTQLGGMAASPSAQ